MAERRFGRIIVEGNAAQLDLAAQAYAGQKMPTAVGDVEPKDYRLEFHTKAEFLAAGLVIPGTEGKHPKTPANPKGGVAAYGYTLQNAQWVNTNRTDEEQTYVCRHEPFHPIVAANMTAAKRLKLLALVQKVAGGTAYQNRLSEVLCDAFVELFWGQGSILDSFYGDIADADLVTAWQILTATEPNAQPVPVEPPVPLPLPDPQIADLQTQLVAAQSTIATLGSSVAAAKAAQAAAEARAGVLSSAIGYLVGDVEAAVAKVKARIA